MRKSERIANKGIQPNNNTRTERTSEVGGPANDGMDSPAEDMDETMREVVGVPPVNAQEEAGAIGRTSMSDGMNAIMQRMASMCDKIDRMQQQLESSRRESREEALAREALERRVNLLSVPGTTAPPTFSLPAAPPPSFQPATPHRIAGSHGGASEFMMNRVPQRLIGGATSSSTAAASPRPSLPGLPGASFTSSMQSMMQKPYPLPEFCGTPEQWPTFIAAFRQSTEAFGYTPLQNLFRLQKALTGEARVEVEFLLTSPANVEDLIEALEFRFGRPDILTASQMAKVREMPHITERRLDLLVPFASRVQNLVAFLNTDASRHVLGDTTLLAELVGKLPQSKLYEWMQHSINMQPRATVVQFAKWLRTTGQCVSMMATQATISHSAPATHAPNPGPAAYTQPARSGGRAGRNTVLNLAPTVTRSTEQPCVVCERSHPLQDCSRFRRMSVADRLDAAKRHVLCFCCLRPRHRSDRCAERQPCQADGCPYWHHPMLHDDDAQHERGERAGRSEAARPADGHRNPFARQSRPPPPDGPPARGLPAVASAGATSPPAVLMCREVRPLLFRILPVTLHGVDSQKRTFALLDEGSAFTLLDAAMATQLGLSGPSSTLNVQWIGQQSTSQQSQTVQLHISGASQQQYRLADVRTVSSLNLPRQTLSVSQLDGRLRHLPIDDYRGAEPTLLIGLAHSNLGVAQRTRTSKRDGTIAAKTPLGWVVYGPQSRCSTTGADVLHIQDGEDRLARLERLVKAYHTTDSFGVKCPERLLESDDDARARRILHDTTVRVGGHFQTGLLWRTDDVKLPDSYAMASQRFATLEKKMRRDPEYARLYGQQIANYIERGYARKLSPSEVTVRDRRVWYIPHFGVQSSNKPGKLRLVFDAAASVHGTSLNTELLSGPDLNQPLIKILHQFRMRRVGVCADIAEMFLQVAMQPCDRTAQRFLWRSGPPNSDPPEVYEMCVMTFGATCSPTSAQFVKNLNAEQHAPEFPAAAKAIRELHYVDDFVASFATESEAISVTRDVTEIHRRGGFNLRGFVSNRASVRRALGVGAENGNEKEIDMQLDVGAMDRILGMRWCTQEDAFLFAMRFERVDPAVVSGGRCPSKREVLSAMMSVFDPFGVLANFVVYAKILMQSLWKVGSGWDEPIPEPLYARWRVWCQELEQTRRVRIPRCYSPLLVESSDVQLHIFADASEQAFAAAAYFRITHGSQRELAFVAGRTRCAPVKVLTVPRLELQAAVMAARLCAMVRECHDVALSKVVLWTDSQTVLQWLRTHERRYKPFVAHRVAEILDVTGESCWRWVPTLLNVADDATRIDEQLRFDPDSRWIRGPAFLLDDEVDWPVEAPDASRDADAGVTEEVRPRFVGVLATTNVVDFARFSSYNRLCRAVGWTLRFGHNALAQKRNAPRKSGELDAAEVRRATNALCRIAQRDGFASEYSALEHGKAIDRSSSLLSMMPYLDDERVMRLYGRTDAAAVRFLSADAKRPILLPHHHRLTALIVKRQHELMGHQFEDGTICAVRRQFWVTNLRALVRRQKNSCQFCKIRAAQPRPTVAGQWPSDRLTPHVPAFYFTGLDYFGPVAVTVGRRHEKRWVALFTCMTTRALHMEIASDLSTDACLMAIKNFINLRGVPARIRSDCGTNFVGADNEIRRTEDFIDQSAMQREMATRGIEWRFNCPANPESGGAWERLVQSTKRVLAVILKSAAPRVETLRSVIIEAANLINSRPLTHVPVCSGEAEPLTPNHFLLGRTNSTTTAGAVEPRELCSRKQWRIHQQMMRQFWLQWIADYLPELTRRGKYYPDVGPLKVGDLVLVVDANQSRSQWTRGRVEKVQVGTDGRVRTAEVRTSAGMLRRPLSKLAVLDVEDGVKDFGESPVERAHGVRDVAE